MTAVFTAVVVIPDPHQHKHHASTFSCTFTSSTSSLSCRSWRPVSMRRNCPQRLASVHQMSTSMSQPLTHSCSMAALLTSLTKSTHTVTKAISNLLLQQSVSDPFGLQATPPKPTCPALPSLRLGGSCSMCCLGEFFLALACHAIARKYLLMLCLCHAVLCCAALYCTVLGCVVLCCAVLCCAMLTFGAAELSYTGPCFPLQHCDAS